MFKKIKTSRWWYNFKDSLKFYLRLRDPDRGDVVDDQIKADTRINKTLGMPPTDEWCKKNPFRTM